MVFYIKLIKFIFLLFILLKFYLYNKHRLIKSFFNKYYNIKICLCIAGKNENRYIREFINYYIKIGVDKIFLYDNNNIDGERFEEVISDFIENGVIKMRNWRGKTRQQINIINSCYKRNYNKFDWLIFYDIDEYIFLKNYNNIKIFLNEPRFNKCQIIQLNWLQYTDNNLIHYENKSLLERFTEKDIKAKRNIRNTTINIIICFAPY